MSDQQSADVPAASAAPLTDLAWQHRRLRDWLQMALDTLDERDLADAIREFLVADADNLALSAPPAPAPEPFKLVAGSPACPTCRTIAAPQPRPPFFLSDEDDRSSAPAIAPAPPQEKP